MDARNWLRHSGLAVVAWLVWIQWATAQAVAAPPELPPRADWRQWFHADELGPWLILAGAFLAGWLLGKVVETTLKVVGGRINQRGWTTQARLVSDLAGPANLVLMTAGLAVGLALIDMEPSLRVFFDKLVTLLISMAVLWYAWSLVSLVDLALRAVDRTNSAIDQHLGPIVRRSLRLVLIVAWALFVVQAVFEKNIGAWLAGLGIAGLAISLAAQDSLKSVFGALTILLDRPFRVGELINIGNFTGTIEDIGFRSTKVRTPAGNLVSIPNSNVVNEPIENVGRRPFIRRNMNLTVTYDTPREKLLAAIESVRAILEEPDLAEPIHPTIAGNLMPPRVFFNEFNADSLNIAVFYWYAPPVFWDYLAHAERVNLRIMEEFERLGVEFAFPTQTLYLAGDPQRELTVRLEADSRGPWPPNLGEPKAD